jgi:quercetin dioxygenase-like cupin family protein
MRAILFLSAFLACSLKLSAADPGVADGYKPVIKVIPLLRTSTTAAGQPIAYPTTDHPEVTAVRVMIPPGAETGWHKHPFPCYGYILSGELTVDMESGKSTRLTTGEALVESVNVLHNGRNTGSEPVTLVMFVMGEKGEPFTVKTAPPEGAAK